MKAANSLRALVLLVALFCVPAACFAQAWSVGEVLRAWRACQDALLAARSGPAAVVAQRF